MAAPRFPEPVAPTDDSAPALTEAPAPARPQSTKRRGSRAVWILAIALVLSLALWATASHRADQLAERVSSLEADLEGARVRLGAYDRHLGDVQRRVGGISAQLGALESVLEAGPIVPKPPPVSDPAE